MQVQNLSESDKTAFRGLDHIDSRAFIITMTAATRDTVLGFLAHPRRATHEDVVAQLRALNGLALERYGITDLERYLNTAITEIGSTSVARTDWTAVQMSLGRAEATFRQIDQEGPGANALAGMKGPKPSEAVLVALRTTPSHVKPNAVNPEFIHTLTGFLKDLSIGQLYQLKDYSAGTLSREPEIFTEMFGEGLDNYRKQNLKSVLNACIAPSRLQGLVVLEDSAQIQKFMAYAQGTRVSP